MATSEHGRRALRVPVELQATIAWGYEVRRCAVTEFSTRGLTIRGLDAPVGAPVAIGLPLCDGTMTVCGVVVHRDDARDVAGIRLLSMPPALSVDLELFLWNLLASDATPADRRSCSVAGCERPRKARGLCSVHYGRMRRDEARARRGRV